VTVCGSLYREELILNVTLLVVRIWEGKYSEEMIVNITLFFFECLGITIQRVTDTKYFCVGCECLGWAI